MVPGSRLGAWLGCLTIIQLGYGYWSWTSYGLLGGAAAGMILWGGFLAAFSPPPLFPRALADVSWWTVFCAIGASTALLGSLFGLWLALPGMGLWAISLGGLGRELWYQRRHI